jgi:hypothetical protein
MERGGREIKIFRFVTVYFGFDLACDASGSAARQDRNFL